MGPMLLQYRGHECRSEVIENPAVERSHTPARSFNIAGLVFNRISSSSDSISDLRAEHDGIIVVSSLDHMFFNKIRCGHRDFSTEVGRYDGVMFSSNHGHRYLSVAHVITDREPVPQHHAHRQIRIVMTGDVGEFRKGGAEDRSCRWFSF